MSEKEESYSHAYTEIIDFILSTCTTSTYYEDDGRKRNWPGLYGFVNSTKTHKAQKGDLIRLQSARSSEYTLSWYLDERQHWYKNADGSNDEDRGYESEWLLKSLKTGNLCWWSNVSLSYFDREELKSFPSWKWNDRQFEFKDKWWNVCYTERDAYITLPVYPEFGENYEVTLGTRTRHGLNDNLPTKIFPDYRKVTKKDMAEFYDECVALGNKKNG